MYKVEDIQGIHLEPSSFCNARCPKCVRNYLGTEYNTGYEERNLLLADIQKIFSVAFVKQLTSILYNGNLGDMIMNPEILEITQWFKQINPSVRIEANTNGSAGSDDFWKKFAATGIKVNFALDGLADTHHLYRQNTSFDRVIHNAKTFIAAGGEAHWKMIHFKHNVHQIEDCKQLAKSLGFSSFQINPANRGQGPVFDKRGNYSHGLEDYEIGDTTVKFSPEVKDNYFSTSSYIKIVENYKEKTNISCYSKNRKNLYINSLGEVYPCCFIGHNPRTVDPAHFHHNLQLKPLIADVKNNALEYPLDECISWFNTVEETWAIPKIKNGRLSICEESCGVDDVSTVSSFGYTGHGGSEITVMEL